MQVLEQPRFYNSLTRKAEDFKSLNEGEVKMYSCGPTVYDYAHIGNFRAYVFSDLIHRSLRYFGYKVRLVMNLTDIDDKTIKNANAQSKALNDYTAPYITAFFEDIKTLRILPAEQYPRATDHIPEMEKMIDTLEEKGHTYKTEDSTYFRISSFNDYGKLSNLNPEEMRAGASSRVASDEYEKEQVSDFVLWKAHTEGDGPVYYESKLGKGRPGWHIECSAMATKYLGHQLDIHTGGVDNKFPHHENEIAQSQCCFGDQFVHTWLHCAHLQVDNQKMSKSLGNFYTLRDLLEKGFSPVAIRYLLIASHYRNHLNFTLSGLKGAEKSIKKVNRFIARLHDYSEEQGENDQKILSLLNDKQIKFRHCLADDLNVSGALGAVFELLKGSQEELDYISMAVKTKLLAFFTEVNGVLAVFDLEAPKAQEVQTKTALLPKEVEDLLIKRAEARKNKDFAQSDVLRDRLASECGYKVIDSPDGQEVEKL